MGSKLMLDGVQIGECFDSREYVLETQKPMEMELVLVPCEHCGGQVRLMAVDGQSHAYEVDLSKVNEQSDDVCFVHCDTCKANWHLERRIDSFPLDTIDAWNRRFSDGTAE